MIFKKKILKFVVIILQKSNILSAASCRLVKFTGKHQDRIHPKHLIQIRPPWFLKYLRKDYKVLDIGCNNGQRTLKAAKRCRIIYGIDYDKHMLNLAKKEAKRSKISNAYFYFGDAEKKLTYSDNEFDLILFLDVLEHLNKRKFILNEIYRVLKPKGLLLLSVPKVDTNWKKFQKSLGLFYFSDPDHKIEFTKVEIKNVLIKAGFITHKILPVTLDTPLVGFIDIIGGISLRAYTQLSVWRRNMALKYNEESIGFEIVSQKS